MDLLWWEKFFFGFSFSFIIAVIKNMMQRKVNLVNLVNKIDNKTDNKRFESEVGKGIKQGRVVFQ
jgi:hypothetical protein